MSLPSEGEMRGCWSKQGEQAPQPLPTGFLQCGPTLPPKYSFCSHLVHGTSSLHLPILLPDVVTVSVETSQCGPLVFSSCSLLESFPFIAVRQLPFVYYARLLSIANVITITWLDVQLCLTLCDAMDCSLPASSTHGILWARILEWVVISWSPRTLSCRSLIPHYLLSLCCIFLRKGRST